MKKNLLKLASHLLTVLIIMQAIICLILLYRTAANRDFALFGYRFYYIVSPSMEPTIHTGAEIVVKEVDTDVLEVGDIITFSSKDPAIKGYPNTHRIVEITQDKNGRQAFVTKGDNNPMADPYLVYSEDIYGKVVMITPALRGLIMFYSFAATPVGFMVVVIMPLLLVFGIFCRSFINEIKESTVRLGEEAEQKTEASEDDMQQMIAVVVKKYMEEHPGQELSMEEAVVLAAGLLKETMEKGEEKLHGKS